MPMQQEPTEGRLFPLPMNVQDAMRDNLPEQVGKLVRERLSEGDNAINKIPKLEAEIKSLGDVLRSHTSLDQKASDLKKREELVASREDVIIKAELRLEADKLKHELTCQQRVSQTITDALLGLVRNTTFRESQFFSHEKVTDYQNGNSVTTAIPQSQSAERTAI